MLHDLRKGSVEVFSNDIKWSHIQIKQYPFLMIYTFPIKNNVLYQVTPIIISFFFFSKYEIYSAYGTFIGTRKTIRIYNGLRR